MSFRRPPPLDTVYSDWTLAPELLLAEAQRLRSQLAANRALPVVLPAVVGAVCGFGTCLAAYGANILPSPDTTYWFLQMAEGALIGAAIALPLAARLTAELRAHAARTFNGGLLKAALGSHIRGQFPHLHGRNLDNWPHPEVETLRQRLRAISNNYAACAADQCSQPWPARWTAEAVAAITLAGATTPLIRNLGSDDAQPWLISFRGYLGHHLFVAWLGFAGLCVLYSLAATYAAIAMTARDAALADGLDRVGAELLGAGPRAEGQGPRE